VRKINEPFFITLLFLTLTALFLFPLFQGLILLPLDLLISNYGPWSSPNMILLKNPYMQDSILQLFPWRHLVFESLTHGIIPLWNPYQQLGAPFMATMKPLVFYPLNVFFLFGEIPAWHLLLSGQIFLSMLFCYFLARNFKLSIPASILTGLSFGLSSFMIGLLEFGSDAHTMVWWPLILLFGKCYLDNTNRKYLLFLGISIALSILGGQLQYMGYFLIFFAAFLIYYGLSIKAKPITFALLSLSIALGMGLTALQMIPSVELFSYSHRGLLTQAQQHELFTSGLLGPEKLFRLFAPDFFGNPVTRDSANGYIEGSGYFGIIALFFALFAMIYARKSILVRFLTGTFIVTLLLSLRGIGEILLWLHIPLITSGNGGRIFTLVLFSGALLAGFGLMEFMTTKKRKKQLLSLFAFAACFILIVCFSFVINVFPTVEILVRSLKFAISIFGLFSLGLVLYTLLLKQKNYTKYIQLGFLIFIIALSFFDLFRLGYRFLTFSNEKFLYPQVAVTKFIKANADTSLARVYGLTEPELSTYLGVYTIESYNPLYLLRTAELIQSLQKLPPHALSADNKYFLISSKDALKYTLDVLGTEYIVISKDENPATKYFNTHEIEPELRKIYTDEKYSVFRNITSYPRFGLYYDYSVVEDDKKMLEMIANRTTDLQKTVLLKEQLPLKLEAGTGSAKLIASTINTQTFTATTDKPALFYISDAWYPDWKVTVNRKETKLYRANYALRAVLLPEGNSEIRFTYSPSSFVIGQIVSVISLLVLFLIAFLPLWKKKGQ
jgi:hypothetical protein